MGAARKSVDERSRLDALSRYRIVDTPPEQSFDDIALIAARICDAPIALVSFVDRDRQWFKARIGLDLAETPREISFCTHAISEPGNLFVVRDATGDERFADNPLVTAEPAIRFYAGAPLVAPRGEAVGTLCILDRQPRELNREQREALEALARQVVALLELRRVIAEAAEIAAQINRYQVQLEDYHERLEQANAQLRAEAVTDSLTGVHNRRAFESRLTEEIDRAARHGSSLSLLLLDVDHFKSFNDEFGHPEGDKALQRVAALLASAMRSSDFVARYGGEEFAIILPNTDFDGAFVLAQRCRRLVEEGPWPLRPLTVSVGSTTYSGGDTSSATLVAEADKALYHAKASGRNRVSQSMELREFRHMIGQFGSQS